MSTSLDLILFLLNEVSFPALAKAERVACLSFHHLKASSFLGRFGLLRYARNVTIKMGEDGHELMATTLRLLCRYLQVFESCYQL